jgi:hypothetical protein
MTERSESTENIKTEQFFRNRLRTSEYTQGEKVLAACM